MKAEKKAVYKISHVHEKKCLKMPRRKWKKITKILVLTPDYGSFFMFFGRLFCVFQTVYKEYILLL